MADFDTQINVGMNVDGVVSGTEKAKRSVRDLGESAREAGRGTGAIGEGMAQSAQKVEQATKSMVGSLQRQIAATEAGDKSTRAYQESLARMRGVDVGVLKPYLDQLDAAKNKAEAAAQSADSLAKSLSAIKVGAALVASAGAAFVAYAKNINDGVDALNGLKDATGASIESLSALEDIAMRTGTSFDTVGASLLKLNQALGASKPGSDTEKAIQAIGLSVADLKALDPADAFQKIAVSLSGYADDANKARLTQELFGKSLKDIAPLLFDVAEAGKLVGTVTTEQAAAADVLNKELFALQKNATDLGRSLISDLVPAINQAIAAFREGNAAGKGFFEIAWDRYWSNVADVYAKPEKTMQQYSARLVEIDKTLASGQIHYVERNRLLKEQFEIQQKIAKANQFSPDNESSAESARLKRRPSVKDIGAIGGTTTAQISAASAAAKAARDQAIKDDIAGFKLMEDARKEYDKRMADGLKAEIAAYNESAKAQEAAQQKTIDAYQKAADSSAQRAAGLADEEAAVALSIASNVSLAVAVEELGLSRTREAQAKALSNGADGATLLALQQEIESREKIVKLISSKEGRDTAADSAKAAQSDWKKAAEKINDSITDALLRGFESGKGFAENLRDTVVNMFKTMVLRPVISAVIGGATGFSGTANAAGISDAAGAANALGTAKSWFTDFGGGVASQASTFGNYLSSSSNATMSDFGATLMDNSAAIGEYAQIAGEAVGYINAATAAAEGKWGKAIGSAAGTYFFGPLGGAVGSAVGSFVDGLFDGSGYVKSTGDAIRTYNANGTLAENGTNGASFFNNTAGANSLVDKLQARYQQTAQQLGIGAAATNFSYGSNDSEGGKFALGGGAGNFSANQGETKTSPEALQLAASRAIFAAVQGSELPAYLSKAFNGLTANTASQEQIASAYSFAESLKVVRFSLLDAATQTTELQTVIDTGFATLGTSADTFRTDFLAAVEAGVTPESLAKWQALGGTMQALEAITKKANEELGKVGRSIADIANERKGLDERYAQATLNTQQLADRARAAIDASNQSRYDEVIALEKAKDATDKAAEAAEREAEIRTGFQQRFDVLSGATTARQQALQADLASTTDTTTQALIQQVYAQEDLAEAAKTGAEALRDTLKAALDASRAGVADAVAAVRTSVDAQKAVVTTAYNTRAEAIKASLDTVGGSIGKLQSLSGSLKSTLDGMRIAGGEAVYRAAAQAQITAALATARAGGGLPVNGQLDNALRTVSQPSEDLFASFAEYAFDFNRTAGEIAALNDLTTTKLSGEELTQSLLKTQADNLKTGFDAEIARLDSLVTAAQAQADAATKATTALQSLADAINAFTASLGVTLSNSLATAFETYDANQSGGVDWDEFKTSFGGMASEVTLKSLFDKTDTNGNGQISQLEAINANTANLLARMTISGTGGNQAGAGSYTGTQVADAIKATTAAGQTPAQIIASASTGYGVTSTSVAQVAAVTGNTAIVDYQRRIDATAALSADERNSIVAAASQRGSANGTSAEAEFVKYLVSIGWNAGMGDKAMGWANGTTNAWATANGFPAFAKGTNYLPEDTMALLHEGEAVIPKAYNPYNPNAAGAGNARLESLVEGLTAEVQRLQKIVNDGNANTRRTADAVNGNPEMPMLVETV